eukprot:gene574-1105_t
MFIRTIPHWEVCASIFGCYEKMLARIRNRVLKRVRTDIGEKSMITY